MNKRIKIKRHSITKTLIKTADLLNNDYALWKQSLASKSIKSVKEITDSDDNNKSELVEDEKAIENNNEDDKNLPIDKISNSDKGKKIVMLIQWYNKHKYRINKLCFLQSSLYDLIFWNSFFILTLIELITNKKIFFGVV